MKQYRVFLTDNNKYVDILAKNYTINMTTKQLGFYDNDGDLVAEFMFGKYCGIVLINNIIHPY